MGGLDDMATWSDNVWTLTVDMLDNGTEYVLFTGCLILANKISDLI